MRKDKEKKTTGRRYFDYSLLFVTIFIVGFGLIMIYSASSYTAQMYQGRAEYYFFKQLEFTVLGFIAMYVTYRIDYHTWRRLAPFIFLVAILLVLALIPFGSTKYGAKRWIRFAGIGIQPADVAKTAIIFMVASAVCSAGRKIRRFSQVILICVVTAGVMAGLVGIVSNNMSSALIILAIAAIMTFVAYPGYKIYAAFVGTGVGAFAVFYSWITNKLKSGQMTNDFRMNRILIWLDPERFATGKGFQTVQGLYAIGSGGLFGKGLGKSLQKLGFIPESQNDMIFSIICEELGLFGATCIILVFAIMLWRIAHIAQNSPDLFGTMLATGVFAHIAVQVILNIAVVTNFIPNTGVSLPFISYGGSSSVVLLAEMGIVLNISGKIRLER